MTIKQLIGTVACCVSFTFIQAQKVTNELTISGLIKAPVTVTMTKLSGYRQVTLDSVMIYSHDMHPHHPIVHVRGVLLKDILSDVSLVADNPKILSTFYFVCTASDGYKVVYSWNELFNSETGNHTMVITAENGRTADSLDDHLALITPTDHATGRRYLKNLQQIIVEQVK